MVEERRWPLGNKVTELHGGFGVISTIKWKDNLIAWANEKVWIWLTHLSESQDDCWTIRMVYLQ